MRRRHASTPVRDAAFHRQAGVYRYAGAFTSFRCRGDASRRRRPAPPACACAGGAGDALVELGAPAASRSFSRHSIPRLHFPPALSHYIDTSPVLRHDYDAFSAAMLISFLLSFYFSSLTHGLTTSPSAQRRRRTHTAAMTTTMPLFHFFTTDDTIA